MIINAYLGGIMNIQESMQTLTPEEKKKLQEIAKTFNTSVENLLSEGRDPKAIIAEYNSGNFRVLNE